MVNNIFDTHTHYNDEKFDENREELLNSLPSKGIDKVTNVGASIDESYESVNLSKKYDYIYAAVGIHPYNVQNLSSSYLDELEKLSKEEKVVAIGEIGLDYHDNDIDRGLQQKIFKEQLSLASELNIPVIIHSREADKDTIDILKQFKLSGVVHCFSSHYEIAKILIDMGFYLGFTGVITFKNNEKQIKSVMNSPLEKILIETDCPYMAPVPYRGKVCNSTMLPYIIEKISYIKNKTSQEIANITNSNACNLFNIK